MESAPAPLTLETKLEALLFWKGEPIILKKAAAMLDCAPEELETALTALETGLAGRGLRVIRNGDEIEMRTAPEVGTIIEKLTKDELMRDLGKAGLETLSIILYKGPVKRSEIDYIRGVNSSFILRNLLIRGLIERIAETSGRNGQPGQGRGYSYKPSIDLLAHLGVAKIEDLPDFAKVKAELQAFADEEAAADKASAESAPSHES
ncbi:MAG TPA: SMC-Scp complex subunit ScpB [Candidatus Paceibacterota bacterium]|nr:SMC-Scp complex subunit ScpB [Candidatus Paceibacterota bacterium]